MNTRTDQELLSDYADSRSETAFAELVRRQIDLVYSAAMRMVGDSHQAKDVTQGVFVALSQNARQLTGHPVLSGWLHRTAQNLAANVVRANVRRQAREQEAVAMNELLAAESEPSWEHIAPHLDAALGELSEPDRDAVMLRYFEKKSATEMAVLLGISDEAAQKRVSRAVERLREFFSKRGISVGAGGLVVVITANAVQAAPVGLAVTISAAALAGTAATTATVIAATKTIAMTTLQKITITAVLTAAVGAGIYETKQAHDARAEVQTLQQQQTPLTEQIQQLQAERDNATNRLADLLAQNVRLRANPNEMELLKLRGEVTTLKNEANDPTQAAAKELVAKVNKIRAKLEQTPEAKIPEFQFLNQQDWLNAANGRLDNDFAYRRALSDLRRAAEGKFASMLNRALIGYLKDNASQMPSDLTQLQPYFDSPMDSAILQRWEIAPVDAIPGLGMGGKTVITQKAPLDETFDTRYGLGPSGLGRASFQNVEENELLDQVGKAYSAANNGDSGYGKTMAELLPYALTSQQRAVIQKNLKGDEARKQAY